MAGYDFRTYDIDDEDDEGPCQSGCCSRKKTTSISPGRVQTIPLNPSPEGHNTCTSNIQLVLLLMAVAGGIGLGVLLRTIYPFNKPEEYSQYLAILQIPAEIILRLLTLFSIPLIISSLVSGIASSKHVAKIGAKAFAFYFITTCLACAEGFGFYFLIQPSGKEMKLEDVSNGNMSSNGVYLVFDTLRNLFPDNIAEIATKIVRTNSVEGSQQIGSLNYTTNEDSINFKEDGINYLGLVVFSIIVGVAVKQIPRKARTLFFMFDSAFEVIMVIVGAILWILPIALLFMIADAVIQMKEPVAVVHRMLWFITAVLAGLTTHFLLVLPLLLLVLARINPLRHFANMAKALVIALATGDSIVTLPFTMDCLRKNAGYDTRMIRLICPIGSLINLDGSCLYEIISLIFISSLRGGEIDPIQVLIAVATIISLSIATPYARGYIKWLLLFQCLGLPKEDIYIILPLDWVLSRVTTVVNIWGDSIGVAVVSRFSKDELQRDSPDVSYVSSVSDDVSVGVVMNESYTPRPPQTEPFTPVPPNRRKSYTLTVQNEAGDVVKVSKV